MVDNAIKMLATRNTKVEIYDRKKLLKTIYVGGPTQDQMGTFMMLEGSSAPFVIHIPGFVGYLTSRFFIEEHAWRSTELFNYNFNDIKSVTVINPEYPGESFKLQSSGTSSFTLTSPEGAKVPGTLDTIAAKFLLSKLEKVNFEFYADSTPLRIRDSLLAAIPYRVLTLDDTRGKSTKLIAWKRPSNGKLDTEGNPQVWDDERMWAMIDDQSWVVIQFYVFSSLFNGASYYMKPAS
jgi:hypothetical protein